MEELLNQLESVLGSDDVLFKNIVAEAANMKDSIGGYIDKIEELEEDLRDVERDLQISQDAVSSLEEDIDENSNHQLIVDSQPQESTFKDLEELWDAWRTHRGDLNLQEMVDDYKKKVGWE